MRQLIRILFLNLAIVFSFGFTVSEHSCQMQETEAHTCCKKPKKQDSPKKCKGDCCVQSTTISRFEELVSNELKVSKTITTQLFYNIFNFYTNSIVDNQKLTTSQLYYRPFLSRPGFLPSKTQCWLI